MEKFISLGLLMKKEIIMTKLEIEQKINNILHDLNLNQDVVNKKISTIDDVLPDLERLSGELQFWILTYKEN
jgi:hypothetical protein